MQRLMVNIDHVATLREARGIHYPDPVYAAGVAEMAGASGIIVHLREDRRHIKDRDVRILREVVRTKLNSRWLQPMKWSPSHGRSGPTW